MCTLRTIQLPVPHVCTTQNNQQTHRATLENG